MEDYYKLPRLFVTTNLKLNDVIALAQNQAHYLSTVMRRKEGDRVRLFNGIDGEWQGQIVKTAKKQVDIEILQQLKLQPENALARRLYFAPIKKTPMAWMIEKAVELGVTHFHPVLTQNTQVQIVKINKVKHQIIEACEQCERLTVPEFYAPVKLEKLQNEECLLLACLERTQAQDLFEINKGQDIGFIIGPEGGFTKEEQDWLRQNSQIVTLGENILRAETAVIKTLSILGN